MKSIALTFNGLVQVLTTRKELICEIQEIQAMSRLPLLLIDRRAIGIGKW
jgi:hypothetical protein